MSWRLNIACCALLLSHGCIHRPLDLRTEFIGKEQLASYHVNTPDPQLAHPNVGQRLIINWTLPDALFYQVDLHLAVTVRFGKGLEQVVDYPLTCRQGTRFIAILNEQFQQMGGIATYKADLLSGHTSLLAWRHVLWNDTVVISIDEIPPER